MALIGDPNSDPSIHQAPPHQALNRKTRKHLSVVRWKWIFSNRRNYFFPSKSFHVWFVPTLSTPWKLIQRRGRRMVLWTLELARRLRRTFDKVHPCNSCGSCRNLVHNCTVENTNRRNFELVQLNQELISLGQWWWALYLQKMAKQFWVLRQLFTSLNPTIRFSYPT